MNGRERLNAVFHKQPPDRLAWTTLVDNATLGIAPEALRADHGMAFYRHIGCDILELDGWGTPHGFRGPRLDWGSEVREAWRTEGERHIHELHAPRGTLTEIYERSHPVKPLVSDLADLKVYRSLWEGARYRAEDDTAAHRALCELIGGDGIVVRFWGPSAIPHLLEYAVGAAGFYYLLNDHPGDVEGLIAAIHGRQREAFDLLARGPCDVMMLVENTSTYYISPDIYRRYNGPHVRDFVDAVHRAGKVAIIHMCGHVRNLLDQVRGTGLDGVHALTPPPTGDTPWELALDALGEDTVIVGALDPTVFAAGPLEGIAAELDRVYTPRLRRSNFILGPFADGIPVPLERFQAIQRWMERNGRRV